MADSPYQQHPSRVHDEPLGLPARAVILGQFRDHLLVLADLLNKDGIVNVVAGCTDLLDCGVVLHAQIPSVKLLICGGYFELQDVQDMLAELSDPALRLLKVPDGMMMQGGGPPEVRDWIHAQLKANEFTLSR
ncbi:hypothetical protein JCM11641_001200 [Rhodosporidiobolus odoratus]